MAFAQNASALSPKQRIDPLEQQQQQQQQQSEGAPPPFLTKTYDMIDDPATDLIVSWAGKGASFVVWNPPEFARDLLPRYFKHNNFSSFVRQLNTYGFRKIDPDRWEFANEGFRRGQRQLLKSIHRRKPTHHHHHHHHQPGQGHGCGSEVTKVGLEGEVERLHRDKTVLMAELVRLRQVQESTERELQVMGQRLHCTEQRQQHMISFMAKAIESPAILSSLMRDKAETSFLAAKRRKLELCNNVNDELDNQMVRYCLPPTCTESTRNKLIEFFSRPDLASKLEAEPLEELVRELSSAEKVVVEGSREERDCAPRATLVEVQHSTLPVSLEGRLSIASTTATAAAAPVVTDITNQSPSAVVVDVPSTPPLDLGLETCTPSPSVAEAPGGSGGEATSSSGQMSETTRRLFRLVGVDSGAVGVGMNSGFWEQFLSPDSRQERSRQSPSEEGRFLGNGIGIRIGSDQHIV